MDKKINSLEELKNFTGFEQPTIRFSEVISLIKKMEDNVDNIKSVVKPGDYFDQGLLIGYGSALEDVKKFFFGDCKFNSETGEIVTTLYGKEIGRTMPPKIKFENDSEITIIKSSEAHRSKNAVVRFVDN